jgi:hypothetical protein
MAMSCFTAHAAVHDEATITARVNDMAKQSSHEHGDRSSIASDAEVADEGARPILPRQLLTEIDCHHCGLNLETMRISGSRIIANHQVKQRFISSPTRIN